MEQRFSGSSFSSSQAQEMSSAPESKRKFSLEAQQGMVERLKAMTESLQDDGYIAGWPSFASMTELHHETASGLLDDSEITAAVQSLANKLAQQDNPEANGKLDFLKEYFLVS